jgi:DNA (cytosine-5)-methyltransferase 1
MLLYLIETFMEQTGTRKELKFIDLFAGVGGFHLAFKDLATCNYVSEWNTASQRTYLANFGEEMNIHHVDMHGDITEIDPYSIPDHDILCAGFPCQPFSIAGKQEGFEHATQGTLFFNIMEIVKAKKPTVIFLENVKNLVSHDKGNTFRVICDYLNQEGYFIKSRVLNGKTHANVPQNRERIFIIGFKQKEHYDNFEFPNPIPLTRSIHDCLEKDIPEKYYQTDLESPSVRKMIAGMQNKDTIYQYRRYYMRENKDGVCPTLTANMGTGGHNVPLILDDHGVRKLTPRECFNFQGYPVDFALPNIADSHLYKQAGNSVVMPLVKRIAEKIILAMFVPDYNKLVEKEGLPLEQFRTF